MDDRKFIARLARVMRSNGIEELEYAPLDTNPRIRRIRLNPHWRPPIKAAEQPELDANPEANAVAMKAYEEKVRLRHQQELQAAEDRIRYAATDGIPDE